MELWDKIMWFRVYVDGVQSTNVKRVKWDSVTKEMVIQFQNDRYYTYYDISEKIYTNVLDGLAGTKTAGPWGPVGKYPSVGAAVHQWLIQRRVRYKRGGRID